jgi:hypothetical protein
MRGRPSEEEPLPNFRSGKWRSTLAERTKKTGEESTFRFKNRTKFHELMLEHEKGTKVTREQVANLIEDIQNYIPESTIIDGSLLGEEAEDSFARIIQSPGDNCSYKTKTISVREGCPSFGKNYVTTPYIQSGVVSPYRGSPIAGGWTNPFPENASQGQDVKLNNNLQ